MDRSSRLNDTGLTSTSESETDDDPDMGPAGGGARATGFRAPA